jgi:hypothetical protein
VTVVQPHVPIVLRLGLYEDKVPTLAIPIMRQELVIAVEEATRDHRLSDDLLSNIDLIVSQIEVIPLCEWIRDSLGCGCVVGEYLVLRRLFEDPIDELAARKRLAFETNSFLGVTRFVNSVPEGDKLLDLGTNLDELLGRIARDAIEGAGRSTRDVDYAAILVVDDFAKPVPFETDTPAAA